jgi:sulfate adenylyltransferase
MLRRAALSARRVLPQRCYAAPGARAISTAPPSLLLPTDAARAALMEEARGVPELTLTSRQLCDVELLLNGGFNPLDGFLDRADTESVYDSCRLMSGALWPMPINLDVDAGKAAELEAGGKGAVALRDKEGNLIALMDLTDAWEADKAREAEAVFGGDPEHPAIQYLHNQCGDVYLGGKLRGYQLPPHYDYTAMRHTPQSIREHYSEMGWEDDTPIVAFQTRNPMHRAHVELVKRAADNIHGHILVHPVVGMTKPGDVDYHTRIKCIRTVLENGDLKGKGAGGCTMSVLPLAMRMGGPREALWHMLIRKNFGATHFILGRDHAGPGSNSQGEDFYGPYDARDFGVSHREEVGIGIEEFEMMVYLNDKDTYIPESQVDPEDEASVRKISGTEVRRRLQTGEEIPAWFSSPDVIRILRSTQPPPHKEGLCLFFTGLSGSGKSTIANALLERLLESDEERNVTVLDGDHVRQHLSSELGFSREHRDLNIQRIGFVASEVAKHGGLSMCAAIAPYADARNTARRLVEEYGRFIEIHVDTPLAECENRDRKGLYAKARAGELKGMTGIDDPYEVPEDPEIRVVTGGGVAHEVDQIMDYLREQGYIALPGHPQRG